MPEGCRYGPALSFGAVALLIVLTALGGAASSTWVITMTSTVMGAGAVFKTTCGWWCPAAGGQRLHSTNALFSRRLCSPETAVAHAFFSDSMK